MAGAARDTESDAAAQALVVAGQRRVNMMWELTQALIALGVTGTTLFVAARDASPWSEQILGIALGLVVGFYFSRTNHTQIGGVGSKPKPPYEGR